MDERGLTEFAAKAAGLDGEWSTTVGGWPCLILPGGHPFQPLHDDGDAFRLSMATGAFPDRDWDKDGVLVEICGFGCIFEKYADNGGDICATARLAIVKGSAFKAEGGKEYLRSIGALRWVA